MSLTIIAGEFKGRKLASPSGPLTKPTLSLLRKSVFDICRPEVEGSSFLDLFACSGAMGIEAVSRGAAFATFVEKDRGAVRTILQNIQSLGIEKKTRVLQGDVFKAVQKLPPGPYDVVYIDPPYPLSREPESPVLSLLRFLDESPLLAPSALVFLEEGADGALRCQERSFGRLVYKNGRRFGSALLHLFVSK